tara:strand:+ start:54 stop:638 length:585 start_codon:yes stop_codon:yes gene_type:complete
MTLVESDSTGEKNPLVIVLSVPAASRSPKAPAMPEVAVTALSARMPIARRAGNRPEATARLTRDPGRKVAESAPSQTVRVAKERVVIDRFPKGHAAMEQAATVRSPKGHVGRALAQTGPFPKDPGAKAQVPIVRYPKALVVRPGPVGSLSPRVRAAKLEPTGRLAHALRARVPGHRQATGLIAPAGRARTRTNS